ncbi:hypothetical protein BsWGS_09776 [Bradybaena similaris]
MPGLILFGRRWAIGSDDFVFPSLAEAAIRIIWVAVLAIIFAVHQNGFICAYGSDLRAFYIGSLVINSISIVILIMLLHISMQGTITDSFPRRNIGKWIYAKLFLHLPEAVWLCISTYWAFGHSFTCDWSVITTVRGAVIFAWIVGFAMFVGILVVFDPTGSAHQRQSISCSMSSGQESELTMGEVSTSKVWETRCRVLCCCIACNPDTKQAFIDVSKVVAAFFKDIDLVPTDVAAGLVLVQKQQLDSDSQLASVVTTGSSAAGQPIIVRPDNAVPEPKPWMTIPNMLHYMKYAMGSYGWPFFIYDHLSTGVCRLCPHYRFCACIRTSNGVISDNVCQCNTAAIKELTGITDDDIIYVTFHNKFKQVPFYVVVDRETHSVVISIRGTLSFQDALADLHATGAELDIPGVPDSYCHAAMLDCANYILAQLQSLRILDTAFAQLETEGRLVITGHSLGAGVAAIMAVLLRPQYPDLICFSFSPPGGLMSANASKYAQDFVCSVVVGKDLVPRLGMYTLVDLKVKILRALCHSTDPKYKILATGCLRLLCCAGPTRSDPSSRSTNRGRSSSWPVNEERVPILRDTLKVAETQLEQIIKSPWPLHPAGQILHITELDESPSFCGAEPTYVAVWSRPENFDRIVISHKMVSDHVPNVVHDALNQLYQRVYVPGAKCINEQHC